MQNSLEATTPNADFRYISQLNNSQENAYEYDDKDEVFSAKEDS